jgi:hypothetical protein
MTQVHLCRDRELANLKQHAKINDSKLQTGAIKVHFCENGKRVVAYLHPDF